MPSLTPLAWALSPATALPNVKASARSNPRRSATTAAHRVRTGARLIVILRPASTIFPLPLRHHAELIRRKRSLQLQCLFRLSREPSIELRRRGEHDGHRLGVDWLH